MKRYINDLCYIGNKVKIIDDKKEVIDEKISLVYDESIDKFIELDKSMLAIMDCLHSSGNLYDDDFLDDGIPYKVNESDIFIDEDSISLDSNECEYLKRLVKEGRIKVPKLMLPDKSVWEKSGFSFNDPHNDKSDYCYMDIPSNWSLEINERCGVFNIIDDKGRARGYINPSINNHYKEPFMILFSRYNIHRYVDESGEYLYFGEKDRPFFMSPLLNDDNRKMNDIIIYGKSIIEFPGWKNPSKYWDRRSVKKLVKK